MNCPECDITHKAEDCDKPFKVVRHGLLKGWSPGWGILNTASGMLAPRVGWEGEDEKQETIEYLARCLNNEIEFDSDEESSSEPSRFDLLWVPAENIIEVLP